MFSLRASLVLALVLPHAAGVRDTSPVTALVSADSETPSHAIPPKRKHNPKHAFATIHYEGTPGDPEYLLGVRVTYESIRMTGLDHDFLILCSPSVTPETRRFMTEMGAKVVPIQDIPNPYKPLAHFNKALNKIHLWAQTDYERLVYLDADVISLGSKLGDLFDCGEFCAGFMNPIHFHTGVMTIKPDKAMYAKMIAALGLPLKDKWGPEFSIPGTLKPTHASYDGADQGFLNSFFPHEELNAAPLFNDENCRGGNRECLNTPMMRLPVTYTMNALWYFEKVSWKIWDGAMSMGKTWHDEVNVRLLTSMTPPPLTPLPFPFSAPGPLESVPGHSLEFCSPSWLKPWYWWSHLVLDDTWQWWLAVRIAMDAEDRQNSDPVLPAVTAQLPTHNVEKAVVYASVLLALHLLGVRPLCKWYARQLDNGHPTVVRYGGAAKAWLQSSGFKANVVAGIVGFLCVKWAINTAFAWTASTCWPGEGVISVLLLHHLLMASLLDLWRALNGSFEEDPKRSMRWLLAPAGVWVFLALHSARRWYPAVTVHLGKLCMLILIALAFIVVQVRPFVDATILSIPPVGATGAVVVPKTAANANSMVPEQGELLSLEAAQGAEGVVAGTGGSLGSGARARKR